MNLREAYLYIDDKKLQDHIKKFDIQVRSIKFMLEEQTVIQVIGLQSFSIDALKNAIKGEIVARYILNESKLKQEGFYFRIEEKEARTFDINGVLLIRTILAPVILLIVCHVSELKNLKRSTDLIPLQNGLISTK